MCQQLERGWPRVYACNEYISSQHPGLVQLLLKDSGFTDLFFFAAWLSSTARMYRLLTAAIGHSGTPATQQGSGKRLWSLLSFQNLPLPAALQPLQGWLPCRPGHVGSHLCNSARVAAARIRIKSRRARCIACLSYGRMRLANVSDCLRLLQLLLQSCGLAADLRCGQKLN